MKRKTACGAFWILFLVVLFVCSTILGALLTVSSDVDLASTVVLLVLLLLLAVGLILLYRLYDPFKERYSLAKETPLTYHKICCYLGLPLGVLLNVGSIFQIFDAEDFHSNSFYIVDLVFRFASLILASICLTGLRKLKSYAWYALMINLLLGVLYATTVVIIHAIFNPFLATSSLATLMITIYVSAIMALYYCKRKGLFVAPQPVAADTTIISKDVENESDFEEVIPSAAPHCETAVSNSSKRKFCSRCGYAIDPVSKKCTGCGKQYFKGIPPKILLITGAGTLLIISCVLNISQYGKISDLNREIASLNDTISKVRNTNYDLLTDLSDLRNQTEFFDKYVVFVEDDGTNLYHKYGCNRFAGDYFWAFNVEAAKDDGYRPCSRCH